MDFYSPIVNHILYPLWIKKNRSKQLVYLKEYEKSQYFSPEEISTLQWKRLKVLLMHAYTNSPFYRKRLEVLDIHPNDISTPDDFLKLPFLTKTDIQEHLDEMIAFTYDKGKLIRDMTGGSTGSPLVFYYDRERLDSREASRIRHNRWAGWEIGDKVASLWGAPMGTSKRKAQFRKWLLRKPISLDAASLTENKMFAFAKELNRLKPKIFLAYSNVIYLFSKFIEHNKIPVYRPKAIICTAEVLLEEQRSQIEKVFGCKVFNRYGSREVALIASECEYHKGLHINAESLYVEVIRDGIQVVDGEIGAVIITDLLNFAMPLIRYKIGDVAKKCEARVCQCGRGLPMLRDVQGRVTDFLITPEGKIVSGVALATYMITNISGVKQIQLVQERPNQINIKLATNHHFQEASRNLLLARAVKFLGNEISIKIIPVESIPHEPSGKFRFSISQISPF